MKKEEKLNNIYYLKINKNIQLISLLIYFF